jgi:type VI secretion system Hcp family effector
MPQAPASHSPAAFGDVMSLQASIGNAAVGQLLGARDRALSEQATPVDRQTQGAIDVQAGAGEVLSGPLQTELQGVAGAALDGVRIHRNEESDKLTRGLSATAFTQGRDVFLRSDRDPASAQGRATLAHELSHVAQGSVGAGAVLREPDTAKDVPGVVALLTLDGGGTVDGGSNVAGHQGEVEFRSLSMPVGRAGTGAGRGGGEERKEFLELNGLRVSDKATTALSEAAAKGKTITEARFAFIKQDADGAINEYFTLELKNGIITSFVVSSDAGVTMESLGFSFEKPA